MGEKSGDPVYGTEGSTGHDASRGYSTTVSFFVSVKGPAVMRTRYVPLDRGVGGKGTRCCPG